MGSKSSRNKRGSVVGVKGSVGTQICPFDHLPCSHVESCDDVVAVLFGEVPSFVCSRSGFSSHFVERGGESIDK